MDETNSEPRGPRIDVLPAQLPNLVKLDPIGVGGDQAYLPFGRLSTHMKRWDSIRGSYGEAYAEFKQAYAECEEAQGDRSKEKVLWRRQLRVLENFKLAQDFIQRLQADTRGVDSGGARLLRPDLDEANAYLNRYEALCNLACRNVKEMEVDRLNSSGKENLDGYLERLKSELPAELPSIMESDTFNHGTVSKLGQQMNRLGKRMTPSNERKKLEDKLDEYTRLANKYRRERPSDSFMASANPSTTFKLASVCIPTVRKAKQLASEVNAALNDWQRAGHGTSPAAVATARRLRQQSGEAYASIDDSNCQVLQGVLHTYGEQFRLTASSVARENLQAQQARMTQAQQARMTEVDDDRQPLLDRSLRWELPELVHGVNRSTRWNPHAPPVPQNATPSQSQSQSQTQTKNQNQTIGQAPRRWPGL